MCWQVRQWRSRRIVALKYVFGSLIPCIMMYWVKMEESKESGDHRDEAVTEQADVVARQRVGPTHVLAGLIRALHMWISRPERLCESVLVMLSPAEIGQIVAVAEGVLRAPQTAEFVDAPNDVDPSARLAAVEVLRLVAKFRVRSRRGMCVRVCLHVHVHVLLCSHPLPMVLSPATKRNRPRPSKTPPPPSWP